MNKNIYILVIYKNHYILYYIYFILYLCYIFVLYQYCICLIREKKFMKIKYNELNRKIF